MSTIEAKQQKIKVKDTRTYKFKEMQEDTLDELIAAHVKDVSAEEKFTKMSKMQEELSTTNKLETKIAWNMKLKRQEENWEEIIKDYREMIKECKEMQVEKDKELKRLNREVNELRCVNRTCKERSRQQ